AAVQVTSWILFLIQLKQGARGEHLLNQAMVLSFRAVTPDNVFRTGELGTLVNPLLKGGWHTQALREYKIKREELQMAKFSLFTHHSSLFRFASSTCSSAESQADV